MTQTRPGERLRLLTDTSTDQYRALMEQAVDRIGSRFAHTEHPAATTSPEELADAVGAVDLDGPPAGPMAAVEEIDRLFMQEAVWFHTPGYLAHLNCPVEVTAVVSEAVQAAVNTSVDTYDQSRAATFIERHVLSWACGRAGFDQGDGMFTSGGTQSNLQALLLARERALDGLPEESRSRQLPQLTVLSSAESHFSVAKSAMILGLPSFAVVPVHTDDHGRLCPIALREAMEDVQCRGRTVMAVVATAGTTDRGVIDPLEQIADAVDSAEAQMAQRPWLHVDGAYGGGLLVSQAHRGRLAGVERADSLTVDFHKMFFQPVPASALLLRQPEHFAHAQWNAEYLNPASSPEPNQVDRSLQTTRRFDALKLFATLRGAGAEALGHAVDEVLTLAAEVHAAVEAHPSLQLLSPTDLSTVLFRWQPTGVTDELADALVALIRSSLQRTGRLWVAKTMLEGRPALKLTLLNPEGSCTQVIDSLEDLVSCAEDLHAELYGGSHRAERTAETTDDPDAPGPPADTGEEAAPAGTHSPATAQTQETADPRFQEVAL